MKKRMIGLTAGILVVCTACAGNAGRYKKAQSLLAEGKYEEASGVFTELEDYEDAASYAQYAGAMQLVRSEDYTGAAEMLGELTDFLDSQILAVYYDARAKEQAGTYSDLQEAKELYVSLGEFEDCEERAGAVDGRIVQMYSDGKTALEQKNYTQAYQILEPMNGYEDVKELVKTAQYGYAIELIDTGFYENGLSLLEGLGENEQAQQQYRAGTWLQAFSKVHYEEYEEADDRQALVDIMYNPSRWIDSAAIAENLMERAQKRYDQADYRGGDILLRGAMTFETDVQIQQQAKEIYKASCYAQGVQAMEQGAYDEAQRYLTSAGDYQDAAEQLHQSCYRRGCQRLETGDYIGAEQMFLRSEGYGDAQEKIKEARFGKAKQLLAEEHYLESYAVLKDLGDYEDAKQILAQSKEERGITVVEAYLAQHDFVKTKQIMGDVSAENGKVSRNSDEVQDLQISDTVQNAPEDTIDLACITEHTAEQLLFDEEGGANELQDGALQRDLTYVVIEVNDGVADLDVTDLQANEVMRCTLDLQKNRLMMGDWQLMPRDTLREQAVQLLEEEKYEQAGALFEALGQFEDCLQQKILCMVRRIAQQPVGSVVSFGQYEQDADMEDGQEPIEWVLLENEDGQVTLLSRNILDCRPYHSERVSVNWENASLRSWLNAEFISSAFTLQEAEWIVEDTWPVQDNPMWPTKMGPETTEKISLPGIEELEMWLPKAEERSAEPTPYALEQGIQAGKLGTAGWYLRSPGRTDSYAAFAAEDGSVNYAGCSVGNIRGAVRPLMRLYTETKAERYAKAEAMKAAGLFEQAIEAFEKLDGFEDSEEQIGQCRIGILDRTYEKGISLKEQGKFKKALKVFVGLDGYRDSCNLISQCRLGLIGQAEVGSTVRYGSCEQDGDLSNGQELIEWIVLEKEEGSALLLSKYGLDCQPYDINGTQTAWENSTLRLWLNDTFLTLAFSDEEAMHILCDVVEADPNAESGVSAGADTKDWIFLPGITQVRRYFVSDEERRCEPTAYAKEQGAWVNENGTGWWWLRSPGGMEEYAANVSDQGMIYTMGYYVGDSDVMVRPMIRVDLSEMDVEEKS